MFNKKNNNKKSHQDVGVAGPHQICGIIVKNMPYVTKIIAILIFLQFHFMV